MDDGNHLWVSGYLAETTKKLKVRIQANHVSVCTEVPKGSSIRNLLKGEIKELYPSDNGEQIQLKNRPRPRWTLGQHHPLGLRWTATHPWQSDLCTNQRRDYDNNKWISPNPTKSTYCQISGTKKPTLGRFSSFIRRIWYQWRTRTGTLLRARDFESRVYRFHHTGISNMLRSNQNNWLSLSAGNYTFAHDNGKSFCRDFNTNCI